MALCLYAEQAMQAQVEAQYNWSILYDINGAPPINVVGRILA
jgi:hypothetical protein